MNLHETRYGPYTEVNSPVDHTLDRNYGAKGIADLEISRVLRHGTELAVGAQNLFDTHPDPIGVINAQTGAGQYGNFSPFGITGGYYYFRVSQTL